MVNKLFFYFFILFAACKVQAQTIKNFEKLLQDTAQLYNLSDSVNDLYNNGFERDAIKYSYLVLSKAIVCEKEKIQVRCYVTIANYWSSKYQNEKAISIYLKALKISERINFKRAIGAIYGNMADLYYQINQNKSALLYVQKQIAFAKTEADTTSLLNGINLLASIYDANGRLDLARQNYLLLEKIVNANTNKQKYEYIFAYIYSNLADLEMEANNLELSEQLYNKAIGYKLKYIGEQSVAVQYHKLGNLYLNKKEYKKALVFGKRALQIKGNDFSALNYEAPFTLARAYANENDFEKGYLYMKQAYFAKDTFLLESNNDKLNEFKTNYEVEKKSNELKLIAKAQELKQKGEIKFQKLIKNTMLFASIAIALFGLYIAFNLRKSNKANKIISAQKREVEIKNKEIEESLYYAKGIQDSMLPSLYFKSLQLTNFIFYRPKDIVSGDFYWNYVLNDNAILICVADCTGHGVPGALTSFLCSQKINEAIENNIFEPAAILNFANKKLQKALASNRLDGMDCAMILIEKNENKLFNIKVASANRPVYYISQNKLFEIPPTKSAIGNSALVNLEFTQTEINLQKLDCIYLFTDGITDQFGGDNNKKYSTKRFKNFINQLHMHDMQAQLSYITAEYDNWKGPLEQLDDICVMGIKLS